MRFILTLCAAALVAPTPSAWQAVPATDWPIAAGSRVRIHSPVLSDRYSIGIVVAATPDTLTFRADKDSTPTAILPTARIRKIEIARGTHTNKAKGAMLGMLAGAVAGATIGARHTICGDFPGCELKKPRPAVSIAIGSLVGGLTGAIIGAWVGRRPTETWVSVAVPRR